MEDISKLNIKEKKVISLMTDGSNKEPYLNEYWKAYIGNNLIHFKNKTFENCWLKYKYAKKGVGAYIVDNNSNPNLILPNIIDLDKYIKNTVWRCKIKNTNYWNEVRELYKNTTIPINIIRANLFKDTNFSGELIININEDNYYLTALDAFYSTNIENIILNLSDTCKFSVGQNMFRGARNIKTIVSNKPIGGRDISGMFEFCSHLQSYSNNLIDWGDRVYNDMSIFCNNIAYAYEWCSLKEIPSFNISNRYADDNTMISHGFAEQAFNYSSVQVIGPVIDCILIDPMKENSARIMFNCIDLRDVRIKNLNHGDWHLDGKGEENLNHGNLPNLNKESIEYLFANLYDLNKHNPSLQDTDDTNPHRNKANLYCPIEWQSNITKQMLDAAKLKNWSIYIGGILKN